MIASIERAVDETDRRLSVCPSAFAIPTQGPLDSFGARTYPACYVEWWFGDGAPGLDRERPMLYEQVARRLINIEEHEEICINVFKMTIFHLKYVQMY